MKTIIIIVALTLLGLIAAGAVANTINGNSIGGGTASEEASSITVSVTGEVNRPGSYVLSEGATLLDLLTAAGGVNTNADSLAYNTDCVLSKKSYYIAPIYDNSNTCSTLPISKANINGDDADKLHDVAGFSKTVAASIVSYRSSNGSFSCIEQIEEVSGIGPATFLATRDKITLRYAG